MASKNKEDDFGTKVLGGLLHFATLGIFSDSSSSKDSESTGCSCNQKCKCK
jgi:hypothetical protein